MALVLDETPVQPFQGKNIHNGYPFWISLTPQHEHHYSTDLQTCLNTFSNMLAKLLKALNEYPVKPKFKKLGLEGA